MAEKIAGDMYVGVTRGHIPVLASRDKSTAERALLDYLNRNRKAGEPAKWTAEDIRIENLLWFVPLMVTDPPAKSKQCPTPEVCPDCGDSGYVIVEGVEPACCGNLSPGGGCHGGCAVAVQTQEQAPCPTCGGATAPPIETPDQEKSK